jgi:hypothetical protein
MSVTVRGNGNGNAHGNGNGNANGNANGNGSGDGNGNGHDHVNAPGNGHPHCNGNDHTHGIVKLVSRRVSFCHVTSRLCHVTCQRQLRYFHCKKRFEIIFLYISH